MNNIEYKLDKANRNNDIKTFKSLLQSNEKININVKNFNGYTFLQNAANWGNFEIVKLLIKFKADINLKDRWGRVALDLAKTYNHKDIIKLLTDKNNT